MLDQKMLAFRILRVPFAAATSSTARISRFGNFASFHSSLKLRGLKSQKIFTLSHFSHQTFVSRNFCQYAQGFRNSGCKVVIGTVVICTAVGSSTLWPQTAYCADGSHTLDDNCESVPVGAPRPAKGILSRIITLMHKLLVPIFLMLTVWTKWGQIHPLFLTARVLLIFLCTKPIPSSVHIFVHQLKHQIMSQNPLWYRFKTLHANKVEVDDYTIMCLAKVHIKDERLVLVGILSSWWILPLSSWNEFFLFDKLSWNKLVSCVKSRFRLAADMSCR